MIKTYPVEQNSREWLELRAGKYTGSNADKLLKFGTIDYSLTQLDGFGGNYWTERGLILQDQALEIYEAIKKVKIEHPGFVTNSKFPKCGYSPDGWAPGIVIEIKAFDKDKHLRFCAGEIDLKTMAQIQFGLLICERIACDLVLYNPELDPKEAFKVMRVNRQPKTLTNFRNILKGVK